MNISCSAEPCPVILDCSCVFYSGANLIYTGIVTNDTLCASLAKIDQKFKDAAIGYVFQNGIIQAVPGGPVKLGGTLNQNTIITSGGYTFALTGTIESSAFITTGGTSSQFVKGDGSLDSTSYQPAGNYISALTGDGTATGPGSVPFTLSTTGVLPNTYGSSTDIPILTIDSKGRITWATSIPFVAPPSLLIFSGDVTGVGYSNTTIPLTLATVLSTPGTYGSTTTIPIVTVNAKGLVTGISQVSFPAGTGTVTSVGVSPGTGISASVANPTTTPVITITNTAPDQTVVLTDGAGINVTGTYPNFTIANTGLLTVPDLQQVTIAGNETVLDIVSKSVSGFQVKTAINQVLGQLKANSLVNEGELTLYDIAAGPTTTYKKSGINNILFPTGFSGTFALSVNGYTPNSTTGDVTIPVGTGTVTAVTATSPITSSGGTAPDISTSMATNKLIGRSTAGVGVMEEITVGTGLSLSGGTLSSTATGGILHGTASGTDTYTVTITGPTSYADGDAYLIRFTNGNTTSATLDINGLGVIPLYRNNDGALIGGDIIANGEMLCVYNSTLNVFQTIGTAPNTLLGYVTNDDSVTITKGQVVYAFSGQGDRMTVKLANNTGDATSARTVGVVLSTSIAANQKGLIMMQGLLDGLSILPTATWSDGDPVYLGATAGSITNVKPYAPNHLVYVGTVTTASNGSAGRMYVNIQNGYELDELHNVQAQSPTYKDTLWYDNTVSPAQWKTASISTILGYTPFQLPSLTSGSVLFSNGTTIAQDNANFFWDDANNRLGLGTSSPTVTLDVSGKTLISYSATTDFPLVVKNTNASAVASNVLSFDCSATGADQPVFVNLASTNPKGMVFFASNQAITASPVAAGFQIYSTSATNFPGQIYFDSGAHNSASIIFRTAITSGTITERMRIFSGGNVGIGVSGTDAGYKLDVNGTARLNGSTTFGSTGFWDNTNTRLGINQTTPTSRLHINFNQNSVTQSDANGILLANSTAAILGTQSISPGIVLQGKYWNTGTSTSQDVRFRIDVLPVQGTSPTPSGDLRILSSVNGGSYTNQVGISTRGMLYGGQINATSQLSATGSNYTGSIISFYSTNGTGVYTPYFIASEGTPVTAGAVSMGYNATTNQLAFAAANGTYRVVRAGIGITNLTNTAGAETGDLAFSTQSGGTAISEKMRIFAAGNVGIGTTTNSGFKLDVNGTTRLNGNLTTNIATTQIAYSSSGILSGSANLYWDNTNNYLVNRGYYFFEFPLTSGCGLVGRQQGTNNLLFQMGFNAQAQYGGTLGTVSGNQFFVYNFQGAGGAANYYWGFNNSGDNYWGSSNTAYSVRVQQPAVGNIPLAIQGQTSQTARLLTITSTSAGTVGDLMSVFPNGNVAIGTTTDVSVKLNVNGTIRWASTGILQTLGYTSNRGIAFQIGGTATYKTTNAGAALTPVVNIAPNGETSGAISLNYDFNNGNGLNFAAGNGASIIARAGINITNLNNTAGSESGDMTFLTQSGGTAMSEKMRITGAGGLTINATNTAAGTTGNQTINKASGTVNIAAAGTTVTVTNSLVTTSSIVFAVVRTNDATAVIKNVVPGAGSFVINLNAATTAETSIGFFVIN